MKNKDIIKNLSILEDIKLLKSQAERCKEILLRLSKNQLKLKDNFFEKIKITNLIEICFDKFNRPSDFTNCELLQDHHRGYIGQY